MAGRSRPDGGYEYVCTRAELAGIGIGIEYLGDPAPRRNGLRKLRAVMAEQQQIREKERTDGQ